MHLHRKITFSFLIHIEHHLNFKAVESDKVETAEMQQTHVVAS